LFWFVHWDVGIFRFLTQSLVLHHVLVNKKQHINIDLHSHWMWIQWCSSSPRKCSGLLIVDFLGYPFSIWGKCWLVGAWPRFRVDLAKQIPVLLALSATVHGAQTEVSPEVVWEGARTRFPHPQDVWWFQVVHGSTLHACCYVLLPVPCNLWCYYCATLLGGQTMLLPKSLLVIQD